MAKYRPAPHVLPDGSIEFHLTKGYLALVDAIDSDLAQLNWTTHDSRSGDKYAYRKVTLNGKQKDVYLHRVVLERKVGRTLVKGEVCDHINGNRMDDRRENLRIATHQQNLWNQKRHHTATNTYKGAYFHRRSGKWQARIRVAGVLKSLGLFATAEEAYEAYCTAAIKYRGEFTRFESVQRAVSCCSCFTSLINAARLHFPNVRAILMLERGQPTIRTTARRLWGREAA